MENPKCAHCPGNPEAQKPYRPMRKLYMPKEIREGLQTRAQERGLPLLCYMCELIENFARNNPS